MNGQHGGNRYLVGRVTEDEKDQIAMLWNAGQSATEIAQRLDRRSRSSVLGVIHRMKENRDPRLVRGAQEIYNFSDSQSIDLLRLREKHQLSWREISKKLGIPERHCRRHYEEIIHATDGDQ